MLLIIARIKTKIKKLLQSKKEKRHAMVGPAHFWKMKRDFQFQLMLRAGLQTDQNFLDVGCGTLRGGIPIIDYLEKGRYYGIDIRKEVIQEAHRELKEENLVHKSPRLIHFTDYNDLELKEKFHFILAFSVLFHLSDTIIEQAFSFAASCLTEYGVFLANVHLGSWEIGSWEEFPVNARNIDFYKTLAKRHNLSLEVLGTLKDYGHDSGYDPHDLQALLKFTLDTNE